MKYQSIVFAGICGLMAYIPASLSALSTRERESAYSQAASIPTLPPESEIPPPLYPMFPQEGVRQPQTILPETKPATPPQASQAPKAPPAAAPPVIINNNNNNNNNVGGYSSTPPAAIIYPNAPRAAIAPSPAAPAQAAPAPVAPMQASPVAAPSYGYVPPVSGRQLLSYQIRSALSDSQLKRVQYYISADILLSRSVAATYKAPAVSSGEVVFSNGQYVERILISKDTPGQLLHRTVAYRQDGLAVELLGICFEQNRDNIIYFQPVYGFYGFMSDPGTSAAGVQTKYGRYTYEVFLPESAWPYLMGVVNMEYKNDQSRNAPGRALR
jgi:hypothetical protein